VTNQDIDEVSAFTPIKVICVDIDESIPNLMRKSGTTGQEYSRVMMLVRLHLAPIGIMELDIPATGLSSKEVASQIMQRFNDQIQDHLFKDNISLSDLLEGFSMPPYAKPPCLQEEDNLLADAPFVSVAIATRDRVDSLWECLHSILQLDYPNYEVIVVDNAPRTEATANHISSTPEYFEKVRYLREPVPGLAVAHNRALTGTNAPIVVFTDDDVIVDRNWLKAIVKNFQQDPEIACVTGMILPYELITPPQLWIEQFGGFSKGYSRKAFDQIENRPMDNLYPYSAGQFGSGANMAFRTSILKDMGGFESSLGAGTLAKGGDDLAIFFDVITQGYRLIYEPGAILYHKHRRDYSGLANQTYGYGIGLSAFLTRTVLNDPRRLKDLLLKTPAGLKHMLDPKSKKNIKKDRGYPRKLSRLEMLGFLKGPMAYVRSRKQMMKSFDKLPKIH